MVHLSVCWGSTNGNSAPHLGLSFSGREQNTTACRDNNCGTPAAGPASHRRYSDTDWAVSLPRETAHSDGLPRVYEKYIQGARNLAPVAVDRTSTSAVRRADGREAERFLGVRELYSEEIQTEYSVNRLINTEQAVEDRGNTVAKFVIKYTSEWTVSQIYNVVVCTVWYFVACRHFICLKY